MNHSWRHGRLEKFRRRRIAGNEFRRCEELKVTSPKWINKREWKGRAEAGGALENGTVCVRNVLCSVRIDPAPGSSGNKLPETIVFCSRNENRRLNTCPRVALHYLHSSSCCDTWTDGQWPLNCEKNKCKMDFLHSFNINCLNGKLFSIFQLHENILSIYIELRFNISLNNFAY